MSIDRAVTPLRLKPMTEGEWADLTADAVRALDQADPRPQRDVAARDDASKRRIGGVAGD